MMESGRCRPWPEPHAGTLQSVCLAGCSLSVIPTHRCSHCVQAVQVPGLGPRPTGSGIAGVRALLDLELGCSLWSCGSAGKAWNSCSVSPPLPFWSLPEHFALAEHAFCPRLGISTRRKTVRSGQQGKPRHQLLGSERRARG